MRRQCLAALDVFILAGGLGTRVQPVLGDTPKVLAPIAGRPYLVHLLDRLYSFGVWRVVLGLGHQADTVLTHLKHHPHNGITIIPSVEPTPLGTAGALRYARSKLFSDPVLVLNGDSLNNADLCMFLERHRHCQALGSVLCTPTNDANRYGRIELTHDGWVERYIEKDASHKGRTLISVGMYLLSQRLLETLSPNESSLERDVLMPAQPHTFAAWAPLFKFIDIGTPESLEQANTELDK